MKYPFLLGLVSWLKKSPAPSPKGVQNVDSNLPIYFPEEQPPPKFKPPAHYVDYVNFLADPELTPEKIKNKLKTPNAH